MSTLPSTITGKIEDTPTEAFPEKISPMLAKQTRVEPFNNDNWIYEIKWDGWRTVALVRDGIAKLRSRNNKNLDKFGPIQDSLSHLPSNVALDGETVVLDEQGRAYLKALREYMRTQEGKLVYYAFDILHIDGHDVRGLQLTTRKEILEDVLKNLDMPNVQLSKHIVGQGRGFYGAAKARNIEGIMGKRAASKYYEGQRSSDWQKMK